MARHALCPHCGQAIKVCFEDLELESDDELDDDDDEEARLTEEDSIGH